VTNEALIAAGLISKPRDGVKILGQGAITAKLTFEVAAASKSAVAAIEGAAALSSCSRPPRQPLNKKKRCDRPCGAVASFIFI